MESTDLGRISRLQMKDALLRSGYLLEARVETIFREHLGYVEANASYRDPETGKPRELDVYAMAAEKINASGGGFVFAVLLTECVNNPNPLVLLTKEPLIPFVHHEEVKLSGLPVKIWTEDNEPGWEQLCDFLSMEKYHHYCNGRVATQFCSFMQKKGNKKDEWFAIHEGSHFDSFRKLCDAVDYFADKHFADFEFEEGEEEAINIQIYYPVLVLQGDLMEAIVNKRGVSFRNADHIQFRRSSIAKGEETNYQIDVIKERFILEYIDMIHNEIKKTVHLLRRHSKVVRKSIDLIAKEASKAKTPEEIRSALTF